MNQHMKNLCGPTQWVLHPSQAKVDTELYSIDAQTIINHLNNLDTNIQFTTEGGRMAP